MGCIFIYRLFIILLLCSCHIQGSRAQTAVFVKTREDLHLQLKVADNVPEDFITVQWRVNGSDSFVSFLRGGETEVSDGYRGRVDVSVGNFSVKLRNLQKSDSGVYKAQVITTGQSPIPSEYFVTVEDPVSPVKLTVDSVTNSSDPCDLTVTCRSLDSHQISINTNVTCDTTTCSQEGGERSKVTASGATLHVYLKNYKIICVHTNHVSWTNDSLMIDPFCPRSPGPEQLRDHIVVFLVVVFLVVVALIVAAVFCRKKVRGHRVNMENTVYAVPEGRTVHPVEQHPTNGTSGPSPVSTYDSVGPHNGPIKSTETRGNSLPESLYAEAETAQSPGPTNGPPSSIHSLIGPHTGPSASAETRGTSPESLYSSVDKPSKV